MAPEQRILSITTRYLLPNSSRSPKTQIPALGFGVYSSPQNKCPNSVKNAIQCGYRHIDTAQYYENETEVGEGIRLSGIPREELFIVTKIVAPKETPEKTLETLRDSVRKISGCKGKWEGGDGYVDLFLIHGPTPGPEGRKAMWQALEKLRDEDGAREIGVSNFGIKHIEQLLSFARHKPVINQLELHPWCPQPELAKFSAQHGMLLQAYSPLAHGTRWNDPTIVAIAKVHNVSEGQVLIRWSLQKGYMPLPKSDTESRIKGNADVFHFELSDAEMTKIAELGKGLEDGQAATCLYNVHCP